ncbi:MAG: flavodoxin family protein [Archaeoglobaceae archaeon]
MSKILGVGGSPRKKGNSDVMLLKILEGAEDAGAETETVFLRDYKFDSCTGCEKCRTAKACTELQDGMQLLYPKIIDSKGLVLASPSHNYNVSALMKAFIDRLYQFIDFTDDHPRKYSSRLAQQGRKAVLAAVCEQYYDEGMGFTVDGMRLPLETLGYEVVGVVTAELVFHRGKVAKNSQVVSAAYDLGKKMARSLE